MHGVTVCILITISLTVMVHRKGRIPSNLCSPFIDPTDSLIEIKISTWLVKVFQWISLSFIIFMNIVLINHLKLSLAVGIIASKIKSGTITIQSILVTASNLICWLPSSIIYVTSLIVSKYSTELLIWTTVVITPINSIINPLFLILLHRRAKRKEKWYLFISYHDWYRHSTHTRDSRWGLIRNYHH